MARLTASERAARLIAVIGQLHAGATIPVADLAKELDASVAEIAADLETLSMCGVAPYDPGDLMPVYIEDDRLVVWGDLPAICGPVRLSADEARALVAALQAAGLEVEDDLPARLLATAATTEFDAEELEHTIRAATATHEAAVYQTLAAGVAERAVVHMEYVTAGTEAATTRDIEPMALFAERGNWYLTAWCRRVGEWRTFRVDRIRTATATDEHFSDRSGSTATPMSFDPAGLPVARLRFADTERFIERDWPNGTIASVDDEGRTLVEVPFSGTAWIARRVVARLGRVEVLGPVEVREAVAALAASLLG